MRHAQHLLAGPALSLGRGQDLGGGGSPSPQVRDQRRPGGGHASAPSRPSSPTPAERRGVRKLQELHGAVCGREGREGHAALDDAVPKAIHREIVVIHFLRTGPMAETERMVSERWIGDRA